MLIIPLCKNLVASFRISYPAVSATIRNPHSALSL